MAPEKKSKKPTKSTVMRWPASYARPAAEKPARKTKPRASKYGKTRNAAWYRKEHESVPESLYVAEQRARFDRERSTGVSVAKAKSRHGTYKIEKNTYAPLGRPPRATGGELSMYKEMAGTLTDKGHQTYRTRKSRDRLFKGKKVPEAYRDYTALGLPKAAGGPSARTVLFNKARAKEERERIRADKAMEDMMAEDLMRRMSRAQMLADLEDAGIRDFGDYKNIRRFSHRNVAKAYLAHGKYERDTYRGGDYQ